MNSAHRVATRVAPIAAGYQRFSAIAILLFLPIAALAADEQSERVRELEIKLQKSLDMIEQLQKRVNALENSARPQPVPASPTVATAATAATAAAAAAATAKADAERITRLEQNVAQIASASASDTSSFSGIPLRGFADVGYGQRTGTIRKGFNLGSLDFYLAPSFGGGFRGLAELIFETGSQGGLATDLERLQVGYDVNDLLTLWVGRFHTPYGYWNNAFHHGAQIQTSILRPRFIAFEDNGGVLPAHSVGIWGTGKTDIAIGKLTYNGYVANSQTIELQNGAGSGVLSPNTGGTPNGRATLGGSLGIRFDGALKGLETGAHWLRSTIDDDAAVINRTRVSMFGGYLVYDEGDWEIIGETYQFRNRSAGKSFTSNASFLQVGRVVGTFTIFGRAEKARLDQADPYFQQQESGRSYSRVSSGIKFDLTPSAALKFEFLRHRPKGAGEESYNEGHAQLAVRF
jgi:hypothetical protein